MELRKRNSHSAKSSITVNVEQSPYWFDVEGFYSAFAKDITFQLLNRCQRDRSDFKTRKDPGAAMKQTVCYHNTMSPLDETQWDSLDQNVQLLKTSTTKINGSRHMNIKFNDQKLFTTDKKTTTFAEVLGDERPTIMCCYDKFGEVLKMPSMIPSGNSSCNLLSNGAIYTPLHRDEGISINNLFSFVIFFFRRNFEKSDYSHKEHCQNPYCCKVKRPGLSSTDEQGTSQLERSRRRGRCGKRNGMDLEQQRTFLFLFEQISRRNATLWRQLSCCCYSPQTAEFTLSDGWVSDVSY